VARFHNNRVISANLSDVDCRKSCAMQRCDAAPRKMQMQRSMHQQWRIQKFGRGWKTFFSPRPHTTIYMPFTRKRVFKNAEPVGGAMPPLESAAGISDSANRRLHTERVTCMHEDHDRPVHVSDNTIL